MIDINNQIGVIINTFPDGQVHLKIDYGREKLERGKVKCSIRNATDLLLLQLYCSALEHKNTQGIKEDKKELHIPYLMGARFDRVMTKGDSFDLQVIAKVINDCNFEKVYLYDVHSNVATALIKNSVNVNNNFLVSKYIRTNAILICPDAGASKNIERYLKNTTNIVDVVYCIKNRDLNTGKIALKVLEPEKCEGRNCVIIDDLCDGGGTFLAIAEQIKPRNLTLIVTHGIFSKGTEVLTDEGINIICSDSYQKIEYIEEIDQYSTDYMFLYGV
jgi:ribose-phosphate pyrophosphokinase